MNTKNANRLLDLAAFLRELKSDDFDMGDWAYWKDHPHHPPGEPEFPEKAVHCSMAACIGGWATLFHPDLYLDDETGVLKNRRHKTHGWKAFSLAFGLDADDAIDVTTISPDNRTPKLAARLLERTVRQYDFEIYEE